MRKFQPIFLEEIIDFFEGLNDKARIKILFNIDKGRGK
jgi:hypothetical protein